MAKSLVSCFLSRAPSISFQMGKLQTASFLFIPTRSVKGAKPKRPKKDLRLLEMKEYAKRLEMQKIMLAAATKAAKKGEPLDPEMLNPARKRPRPVLTLEEKDRRYLMMKEWSRYQMKKELERNQTLQHMLRSRQKALRELKKVSFTLYSRALELNPVLFPLECKGPTETPPISTYIPPDPED